MIAVYRCIEYTDCPEDMCHLPLVVVCHARICKCLRLVSLKIILCNFKVYHFICVIISGVNDLDLPVRFGT